MTEVQEAGSSPSINKAKYFGILLSCVFLGFVLYKLDFRQFGKELTQIKIVWLLPAIGLKLLAIVCKGVRWRSLIGSVGIKRPKAVIRALFLGYAGNAVLPAKLGELLRIRVVTEHNDLKVSETLATIMIERTFDIIVLMCFFLVTAYLAVLPEWALRGVVPALVLLTGVFSVIGAFLFFQPAIPDVSFAPASFRAIVARFNGFLKGIKKGISTVRSPQVLLLSFVMTFAAWSFEALGIYVFIMSFNITPEILSALVLVVIVTLGVAIPSAPAGVGTHQFLYMVCLEPFGVSNEVAVSLSLVITISMISTLVLVGVGIATSMGLSLRKLERISDQKWVDVETSGTQSQR